MVVGTVSAMGLSQKAVQSISTMTLCIILAPSSPYTDLQLYPRNLCKLLILPYFGECNTPSAPCFENTVPEGSIQPLCDCRYFILLPNVVITHPTLRWTPDETQVKELWKGGHNQPGLETAQP